MKKIILSLGMLIAIATVSQAQNNTSTLIQTDGNHNEATMNQKGQFNQATISQAGAGTTNNKAEIQQIGKNNQSTIGQAGKYNDVLTKQTNMSVANNISQVYIVGDNSEYNYVRVTQADKGQVSYIAIQGDGKPNGGTPITFNQSGDSNQASLLMATGENDFNTVSMTQTGKDGQSRTEIQGDNNNVTISQGGNLNNIGNYAALGPVIGAGFTRTRVAAGPNKSLAGPNFLGANGIAVGITVNAGINVTGDMNTIKVTQGASTRNNYVAIELAGSAANGANQNKVTIAQTDNAEDNQAAVYVTAGQDRNSATINQTGNAQFNNAGIYQRGSDDFATINQSGKFNIAVTEQMVGTNTGSNVAEINQSGNNNKAYTFQEGQIGSKATINQTTNGNEAEIYQIGNGNHEAVVSQYSVTGGSRMVLQQEGTANKAFLNQTDIQGLPTDVEIRQTGMNNTVNGITSGGVTRFIQQNGNNNVINL